MAATRSPDSEASALYRAICHPDEQNTIELSAPAYHNKQEQKLPSPDLAIKIQHLRASNFHRVYKDAHNENVLVKIHLGEEKYNPVDPNEAEVQSLRYLRGMMIIANNLPVNNADKMSNKIAFIHYLYQLNLNNGSHKADDTLWLTDKFAELIESTLGVSRNKALKQLTMARDIGILLEDHPSVCTVTETSTSVTIEKSTPYKITAEYYKKYFPENNVNKQQWLQSASKLAGLAHEQSNNWLENFFNKAENRSLITSKGVSAPPSARWLPIPANTQIVSIDVGSKNESESPVFSHTEFVRSGIITPYDIRHVSDKTPYEYQKSVAKDILKELMSTQLTIAIKIFRDKYNAMLDRSEVVDFHINYQTLLSPLIAERRLGHVDNNARFVKIAKKVMKEISEDNMFQEIAEHNHVNLIYEHTNSAINRNSRYTVSYKEDKIARLRKISSLEFMLRNHIGFYNSANFISKIQSQHLSKQLEDELINRQKACYQLKELLANNKPYSGMRTYQRNITMAALEFLACGSQTLNIDGCKSARDRTAVFACAVKAMKENSAAMSNWEVLEKDIILSLNQGHHFRSMISHSAIIKAALVHKDFMKGFSVSAQRSIKNLLVFARKPPEYQQTKQKRVLASDARFFERVRLEKKIDIERDAYYERSITRDRLR